MVGGVGLISLLHLWICLVLFTINHIVDNINAIVEYNYYIIST